MSPDVSKKQVLVVGDVMLDVWLHGRMTRISPEAPSPVVLVTSQTHTAGGAANIAMNLTAMGQNVVLLGIIGRDEHGTALTRLLEAKHVDRVLIISDEATTIQKNRVLCGGQQILRLDSESPASIEAMDQAWIVESLKEVVNARDLGAVVVADYAKGTLTESTARDLIEIGKDKRIPIFVDTKPGHHEWYRGAMLLKPNFSEALAMCKEPPALVHPGMVLGSDEDCAVLMCRHLVRTYEYGSVVITRGAAGATGYNGQEEPFTSSLPPQEVYDVTGAGDTFMAALVDSFLRGGSFAAAMLRANTAASVAVRHHMSYVVHRHELEDAIRARFGSRGKIMKLPQLCEWLSRIRDSGKSIVMTNGCYRALHHGHIEQFRWAAHQGDVLVVAVNSDASVAALKGDRPIIPEEYRAELIAQQDCVDAVVIFDAFDVTETVKAIKPDILVKGEEYRSVNVPGADFVASRGGEVRFAPVVKGREGKVSSTQLLARMD